MGECDCDEEECNQDEATLSRCLNLYCHENPWMDRSYHDCCWVCGNDHNFETDEY